MGVLLIVGVIIAARRGHPARRPDRRAHAGARSARSAAGLQRRDAAGPVAVRRGRGHGQADASTARSTSGSSRSSSRAASSTCARSAPTARRGHVQAADERRRRPGRWPRSWGWASSTGRSRPAPTPQVTFLLCRRRRRRTSSPSRSRTRRSPRRPARSSRHFIHKSIHIDVPPVESLAYEVNAGADISYRPRRRPGGYASGSITTSARRSASRRTSPSGKPNSGDITAYYRYNGKAGLDGGLLRRPGLRRGAGGRHDARGDASAPTASPRRCR